MLGVRWCNRRQGKLRQLGGKIVRTVDRLDVRVRTTRGNDDAWMSGLYHRMVVKLLLR